MSKIKEENYNIETLIKKYNEEREIKLKILSSKLNETNKKKNNAKYIKIKNNSTIASLKIIISNKENISSEKIHLFFFVKNDENNSKEEKNLNNSITLININEEFFIKNKSNLEECNDTDDINYFKLRLNSDSYPNLYYIITNNNNSNQIVCIRIDFYQQNIEKIILNLEANCSIFLLKNIISNKLKESINITQIKLFCIDITEIEKEKNITTNIKNNDNNFPDWKNLNNIIEYFYQSDINNKSKFKYNIHFLLTIVNEYKMSEQIGLNFRFNYLKEVNKISFNENAQKYRECSDGINLFYFCINQNCSLFNQYFVINIGYGIFNILKQINNVKCPKCNIDKEYIELKNIGIVNSKYYYKGILKTKNNKNSILEGDNTTLDEKLYIFQEAKINSFLSELYIEAKPHFITPEKNNFSKRTEEENELDDIYLSNNTKNKKEIKMDEDINYKSLKRIQNSNNIKIYDNESDLFDKNDIIIERLDSGNINKINCKNSYFFYSSCFLKENLESSNANYNEKLSVCEIF